MRSKFLIGTAMLLAGMGFATAQNMPGGQSAPAQHQGAQSQGAQGGTAQDRERGRAGQAQERTQGQGKQGQTTGQAPQREQGIEHRGAQQEKAQPQQEKKAQPQRSQRERDHTTGQGQGQTQPGAQSPQRQQGQQGQQMQPQQGQQTQPSQGQAREGQAGGNVQLSSEQRTQIRQTVLAGSNVPRVNNPNFAVRVGTSVPTSVHVVEVPIVLVNIHPEWRGFFYFVVGDEIIIVDRGHRIVAVIAV